MHGFHIVLKFNAQSQFWGEISHVYEKEGIFALKLQSVKEFLFYLPYLSCLWVILPGSKLTSCQWTIDTASARLFTGSDAFGLKG